MSMNTYLKGRLRNTALLRSQGLMPLYEAVVNAIQAIADAQESTRGAIQVEILRSSQASLLHDAGHLPVGHPAAVDAAALVAQEFEIDAGDGCHRAGRAEKMQPIQRR